MHHLMFELEISKQTVFELFAFYFFIYEKSVEIKPYNLISD